MGSNEKDIFIIPTHNVPSQVYQHKYATIILDLAAWHNPSITTRGGRKFVRQLPKSIANATYLFTISEYTAQDVADEFGVEREKIIVAPCGLSSLYQDETQLLEKVNGIPLPSNYFLHTGSFGKQKNIPFVIEVYEKFRSSIKDTENPVKLILTGSQKVQNTQVVLKRIKNSPYVNDIIVLGNIKSEEMPTLYKGAIALIFPSTFEGFGMPVIEAISQGTPVLINANTSLTQFKDFGATVFHHFDLQLWVNELISIFKIQQKVDIANINRVKDYFNWDRTAQIVWNAIAKNLT